MKKALIILGSIIVVFVFVLSLFYKSHLLTPPVFSRTQTDIPVEELTPEEELESRRQKIIDRALLSLGLEFKNSDIKWHVDDKKDFCFYDITTPGIDAKLIETAKDGDRTSRTRWNNLVKQLRIVQSGVQKMFTDADDDIGIVLNVVDPQDSKSVFLSVANGVAGIDDEDIAVL